MKKIVVGHPERPFVLYIRKPINVTIEDELVLSEQGRLSQSTVREGYDADHVELVRQVRKNPSFYLSAN